MNVTIIPAKLRGSVTPPPSKSQAHRLIIAAALADGESVLTNVARSQDIEATIRCMAALGAEFSYDQGVLTICGLGVSQMSPLRRMALPRLDCGESGSTLRFLIPIALVVAGGGMFTGAGRLMERPQRPYLNLFDQKGIFYEQKNGALTIQGLLTAEQYILPGNVSSQFVTGLLYALPLLEGDSELVLTSPLESADYVAMTLQALERFGVSVTDRGCRYCVSGGQRYRPANVAVEADWSQAGFWYAAKLLGNLLEIDGLDPASVQGDKVIANHYVRLIRPGNANIDLSQCPDLAPPLAAMAASREGTTRLVNAARLRIKESDRLAAVTQVLGAMGAKIEEGADSLTIVGKPSLPGGVVVDSHNDHRIAMMAAIAATRCHAPITITGAQCVAKSYPNFWEDYEKLGGKIVRGEA